MLYALEKSSHNLVLEYTTKISQFKCAGKYITMTQPMEKVV